MTLWTQGSCCAPCACALERAAGEQPVGACMLASTPVVQPVRACFNKDVDSAHGGTYQQHLLLLGR